jgi:hypothetical protein
MKGVQDKAVIEQARHLAEFARAQILEIARLGLSDLTVSQVGQKLRRFWRPHPMVCLRATHS